jgi:hypothetical protein
MDQLDDATRATLDAGRAAILRILELCGDAGPIVQARGRKGRGALSSRCKWAITAIDAAVRGAPDLGPAEPAAPDGNPGDN